MQENQALQILNALPGIGPITARKLKQAAGSFGGIFQYVEEREEAVPPRLREVLLAPEKFFDFKAEAQQLHNLDIRFISCEDSDFPPLLKHLPDCPLGLYCRGHVSLKKKSLAIIGSRKASFYGLKIAREFAMECTRLGFSIISGLARGIDSAAHEGALSTEGVTIAVLGCGVDQIYPPENKVLYQKIQENGAILSEFPIGRIAEKTHFPMRNRVLSGMSDAVLVVESDRNGGSMITARFAGEQGRPLLVVPGRIDQNSSRGCHQLIRDGATLVSCVDDILEELKGLGMNDVSFPEPSFSLSDKKERIKNSSDGIKFFSGKGISSELSPQELQLVRLLKEQGSLSLESLMAQRPEFENEIPSALLRLEMKRVIAKKWNGVYECRN